jgi:hypothetical protein
VKRLSPQSVFGDPTWRLLNGEFKILSYCELIPLTWCVTLGFKPKLLPSRPRRPGHTWIGNRDKRIGVPAAVRRKGGTSSGGSDNGSGGGVSQGQHISGSSNGCDGRVCRWSMTTREVGVRHKFPSRKIVVLRRPKPKTIFHRGKKAMRTRPAAVRSSHLTNLPMECSGCSNLAEVVSFWEKNEHIHCVATIAARGIFQSGLNGTFALQNKLAADMKMS